MLLGLLSLFVILVVLGYLVPLLVVVLFGVVVLLMFVVGCCRGRFLMVGVERDLRVSCMVCGYCCCVVLLLHDL